MHKENEAGTNPANENPAGTIPAAPQAPETDAYRRAERRIGALTLAIGLAGAAVAWWLWSPRAGLGVGVGGALAWLNGVWMRQMTEAIARLAAAQAQHQASAAKPRVPRGVYARFLGRYALMAAVIYAMFTRFEVPVASVLTGLLALGAAAMVQGIVEAASRPRSS